MNHFTSSKSGSIFSNEMPHFIARFFLFPFVLHQNKLFQPLKRKAQKYISDKKRKRRNDEEISRAKVLLVSLSELNTRKGKRGTVNVIYECFFIWYSPRMFTQRSNMGRTHTVEIESEKEMNKFQIPRDSFTRRRSLEIIFSLRLSRWQCFDFLVFNVLLRT